MPINIYRNNESKEEIDWICGDDWELPKQIINLESWLEENKSVVKPGDIVADIGYTVRKSACGGGAVLTAKSMKLLIEMGIDIYFSEYPSE